MEIIFLKNFIGKIFNTVTWYDSLRNDDLYANGKGRDLQVIQLLQKYDEVVRCIKCIERAPVGNS